MSLSEEVHSTYVDKMFLNQYVIKIALSTPYFLEQTQEHVSLGAGSIEEVRWRTIGLLRQ